jgi:hypothetical protein
MRFVFPRLIAAALILTAAAAPAFAVSFNAGMKAGYSAATLSGDIPGLGSDFKYHNGFTGGVFFEFGLTERLSIQFEAMYVQRGAMIDDIPFTIWTPEGLIEGEQDFEFRLWYFDFPVLAKYTLRKDQRLSPFILAGASYAKGQRTVVEVTSNFGPFSFGSRDDIDPFIHNWDISAVMGGGLNISIWGFDIVMEGRYWLGLMNLDDTPEELSEQASDLKNRAVGVYLGVSIPFSE